MQNQKPASQTDQVVKFFLLCQLIDKIKFERISCLCDCFDLLFKLTRKRRDHVEFRLKNWSKRERQPFEMVESKRLIVKRKNAWPKQLQKVTVSVMEK